MTRWERGTGCGAGTHTGCEPEKEGGSQFMKAFVIYEKSLRDSVMEKGFNHICTAGRQL